MKWKDKNGNECEGTVSEYRELMLGAPEMPKQVTAQVAVATERPLLYGRHPRWTMEENRILKENWGKVVDWSKLLPRRNINAIYLRSLRAGLDNIKKMSHDLQNEVEPRKPRHKKGWVRTDVIPRMKFIARRANYYMKTYNWSREKAFVQANSDYKNDGFGLGVVRHIVETDGVVLQDGKPKIYVLYRRLSTGNKTELVNTYSTYEDAKADMEERKIGDKTIGEDYVYVIASKDVEK